MASHQPAQVIIVAQATLYGAAWAALLADQPNIDVAGVVINAAADVTAYLGSSSSATLLVDFPPPLLPLIQQLQTNYPNFGLLVLVDNYDLDQLLPLLRAGATGCISRDESVADLARAIIAVGRGEIWLPPAVAGVALLMAFGRRGLLGGYLEFLGLDIAFTQFAVILAQTFVAAPFYVKAAILGFSNIEPELEQAAALDGAGHGQVFRFITIPLSWTALLSGMVMTWARALGEFGATIIFAGNYPGRTQTMPLAIYLGFEMDLDVALTLAVILVGLSFMILMVVKGFLHHEVRQG